MAIGTAPGGGVGAEILGTDSSISSIFAGKVFLSSSRAAIAAGGGSKPIPNLSGVLSIVVSSTGGSSKAID